MTTLPDRILDVLKEGLELWRVFIATREEAYKRKRDKQQEKAIQWGEREFGLTDDLLDWITDRCPGDKDLAKFIQLHSKNKRYFNKYD